MLTQKKLQGIEKKGQNDVMYNVKKGQTRTYTGYVPTLSSTTNYKLITKV